MNKDDIDELFTFINENSYFDNSDDEKMENYVNTFNALIESNKQMTERLEITTDHKYEGIECRDETIRLLEKELDDVNDVVAHYGSDVEYKAFLILREENKHRAEVINERDGTIKQLQKRIRTLEKISDDFNSKIQIDR